MDYTKVTGEMLELFVHFLCLFYAYSPGYLMVELCLFLKE